MIYYLMNEMEVPQESILVEEHLPHYRVPTKRRDSSYLHGINMEQIIRQIYESGK